MRFEPAGITDDPELRIATSLVDYIFRRMAVDYLSVEERADLGVLSTAERMQPTLPGVEEPATPTMGLIDEGGAAGTVWPLRDSAGLTTQAAAHSAPADRPLARAEQADGPFCYNCGNHMQRAGSCYVCGSCGTTSGCS